MGTRLPVTKLALVLLHHACYCQHHTTYITIVLTTTFPSIYIHTQFPTALTFALQLGEGQLLRETAGSIPAEAVEMVVRSLDTRLLSDLMRFLADELVLSKHVEFYLKW